VKWDTACIIIYFYISMSIYAVFGNHTFFIMPDEYTYMNIVNTWNTHGIVYVFETLNENKTVFFLYLQKIFNADIYSTRLLNLLLIIANTGLIYSISKNKLALLYPLIPLFLNSMWLTVETIEVFFILFGLNYLKKHMGLAVGMACLFRPYAIIYSLFMNKRNLMYIGIIGLLACGIMYMNDILFVYADRVFSYGSGGDSNRWMEPDYIALIMMIPLALAGYKNWQYSKYAFAGMIGFLVQIFGHYFIVPYTFFFLAYLAKDNREVSNERTTIDTMG